MIQKKYVLAKFQYRMYYVPIRWYNIKYKKTLYCLLNKKKIMKINIFMA